MGTYRHTLKFLTIIISLIIITAVLIVINYEFFLDVDYRKNIGINTSKNIEINTFSKDSNREYKIVYDENDEHSTNLKNNFERVLEITKVNYSIYNQDDNISFNQDDYIILTFVTWGEYSETIENIFTAVDKGANLFVAFIPVFDDYFMSKADIMGITQAERESQSVISNGFVFKGDVMLGMGDGDSLIDPSLNDQIYDIKVDNTAEIYIQTQGGVPIYYTKEFGKGNIGIFNGQNIHERYMDGLFVGILGTLGDDYIYPIVNAGIMFIDDWPGPFRGHNDIIDEQYGMNVDDFMRYVWWPDMLALAKQHDIKYVGQYVLTYDDIKHAPFITAEVDFDTNMFAFGQQIIKYGGELGLHGYNHQPLYYEDYAQDSPLNYTKWYTYEESVDALKAAVKIFDEYFPDYTMNCYVPPSNIISEKGIEAVKEVLGEPVIIAGMYTKDEEYLVDAHDVKYEDGVVYMPRFSSGCIANDSTLNNIALSASMYGMVSHFIHPDDVMDPHRNLGKTWEEMRAEYSKLMGFISDRYPFIEYATATECGNRVIDWYEQEYYIDYHENYIHIKAKYESDNMCMILRTQKQIVESEDYEIVECGDISYFVKLNKSDVKILLKGND